MSDAAPRLCFVAHNAWGALSGRLGSHIGGVERFQALMSRWFARRGYDVSLVAWDDGQAETQVAGVRLLKLCRRDAGLPGLRFFHPRWTSLRRALARADADVYCYCSGDVGLGQIVHWCRGHRRRCLYALTATSAADPALPHLRPHRERVLYRYGLRRADVVLAQTRLQREMLLEGFGVDARVLPTPSDGLGEADLAPRAAPAPAQARVLWVGRLSAEKRFEWLLELAVLCSDLSFVVVGGANQASAYAARMIERAASVPNLRLLGRVPDAALAQAYREASVLCCTSSTEGFPTTFLEAWSRGVPTVTSFDPDGTVASQGLGAVGSSVPELAAGLRGLLSDPERYVRASRNARRHYRDNHDPETVMPRIEAVVGELSGGAPGRGAVRGGP